MKESGDEEKGQLSRLLKLFRSEFTDEEYTVWIRPLDMNLEADQLILHSPNQYIYDQVLTHYLPRIDKILATLGYNSAILKIGNSQKKNRPKAAGKQRLKTGSHDLDSGYTFDTFVEGTCNSVAYKNAMKVAECYLSNYNPLFLYGDVGFGKTHLMQAVGNAKRKGRPEAVVIYKRGGDFMQEVANAIQSRTMSELAKHYTKADALLIDDIDCISRGSKMQEEFFHIFNRLREKRSQMVLSSSFHPRKIEGLQERLRSRFVGGLIVQMNPPETETRMAILQRMAAACGVQCSEEVTSFISEQAGPSVRDLTGAINRIAFHMGNVPGQISLQQVKEVLADLIDMNRRRQISVESIQETIASFYGLKVADLLSGSRVRSIVRPRQLAMALAREFTRLSLSQIGSSFGRRDHSTVYHACKQIEKLRQSDQTIEGDYMRLRRELLTC